MGQRPLKINHENKYVSRSLRLNNNLITELSGLPTTITHFLAEPLQLAWLDLSYNDIGHIHPVRSYLSPLFSFKLLYFVIWINICDTTFDQNFTLFQFRMTELEPSNTSYKGPRFTWGILSQDGMLCHVFNVSLCAAAGVVWTWRTACVVPPWKQNL